MPVQATLHQMLKVMVDQGGSDLHITQDSPPQIRIDGRLVPLKMEPLMPSDTKQLCYSVMTDAHKHIFEETNELDMSFGVKGVSRFRANVFMMKKAVSGVFRTIPFKILSTEDLGLPKVVNELADKPRGLVLVTGPTGSGKSTTLAAMIDRINRSRHEHILTIEDPIEFVHEHKSCLVNQREVGDDTASFKKALKYVLRQDPDVVLVGEMRDIETIEAGMTIAETGHLVFATLHTNSCVQTINRVLDVFPPFQQPQVRTQLSMVLEGAMSQTLIPKLSGKGRALALEIMVPTPAIRNLIREEKIHQIYGQMQIGQEKYGMQTMNQSLAMLVGRKMVSFEQGMLRSPDIEEFRTILASGNTGGGGRRPGR